MQHRVYDYIYPQALSNYVAKFLHLFYENMEQMNWKMLTCALSTITNHYDTN